MPNITKKDWEKMSTEQQDSHYKFVMAWHHDSKSVMGQTAGAVSNLRKQLEKSTAASEKSSEANLKLAGSLRFATWGLVIVGVVQIIVSLIANN
jgi:hypothetical protein